MKTVTGQQPRIVVFYSPGWKSGDPGDQDRVALSGLFHLPASCWLPAHPPWAKLEVPNAPGSCVSSRTCWSKKRERGDMTLFVSSHTLRSKFSSTPRILHEPEKGCGASCSKPSEFRSIVKREPQKGNSIWLILWGRV